MDWLRQNWLWIAVFLFFIWMHTGMHGGHAGGGCGGGHHHGDGDKRTLGQDDPHAAHGSPTP